MYKRLLLALTLLGATPVVHAQKPLRGKAKIDSLQAAYKASSQRLLDLYQKQADDKAAAKKKLDEKNGFRTYHFGDAIASYPDFKLIADDKNTKYYTKPSDNMQIGEANLSELVYGFYKGKLYSIRITTKGFSDSRKVREALEAQYGAGYQSNKYIEDYWWFGDIVSLSYKENSITHDASISFTSSPVLKEKMADEKDSAKKAASDL